MVDLILGKECYLIGMIKDRSMHIDCLQKRKIWVKYYIDGYKALTDISIAIELKTAKRKTRNNHSTPIIMLIDL